MSLFRRLVIPVPVAVMFAMGCGDDEATPQPAGPDASTTADADVDSSSAPADAGVDAPVADIVPAGAIVGERHALTWGGGGIIASWVILDDAKKVKEISWSLPMSAVNAGKAAPGHVWDYVKLPQEAKDQTYVQALGADFRPIGHGPRGVYDVAHSEFHILAMPIEAVEAIDCDGVGEINIPVGLKPTNLKIDAPFGCYKKAGTHGYNQLEPEFNSQKFSTGSHLTYYYHPFEVKTAIVSSLEVKVTLEVLNAKKTFELTNFASLKPPGKIGKATLWPTKLVASYDAALDTYVYTLSNLVAID